jgi:hypothetical protein
MLIETADAEVFVRPIRNMDCARHKRRPCGKSASDPSLHGGEKDRELREVALSMLVEANLLLMVSQNCAPSSASNGARLHLTNSADKPRLSTEIFLLGYNAFPNVGGEGRTKENGSVAGGIGFEPRLTESEDEIRMPILLMRSPKEKLADNRCQCPLCPQKRTL